MDKHEKKINDFLKIKGKDPWKLLGQFEFFNHSLTIP